MIVSVTCHRVLVSCLVIRVFLFPTLSQDQRIHSVSLDNKHTCFLWLAAALDPKKL